MPVAIDACIANNTCFVGGSTFLPIGLDANGNSSGLARTFDFFDSRNSTTPEQKVLIAYQLGTESRITDLVFDDISGTLANTTTDMTGFVWLEIGRSQPSDLTLHFDQSSFPVAPGVAWRDTSRSGSNTQTLTITTDALLSGVGENQLTCCTDPIEFPGANLFDSQGHYPFICVAEGCFGSAKLNLLGLKFDSSGNLSFNPFDTRTLLYSEAAGFQGSTTYTYTISSVPVPAAVWLFGSGIGILLGFTRRASREQST